MILDPNLIGHQNRVFRADVRNRQLPIAGRSTGTFWAVAWRFLRAIDRARRGTWQPACCSFFHGAVWVVVETQQGGRYPFFGTRRQGLFWISR